MIGLVEVSIFEKIIFLQQGHPAGYHSLSPLEFGKG
jgi:hypothetical protein